MSTSGEGAPPGDPLPTWVHQQCQPAPPPEPARHPDACAHHPLLRTCSARSVYLDRLLEVDERNYRTEMISYFYITWCVGGHSWGAGQAGRHQRLSARWLLPPVPPAPQSGWWFPNQLAACTTAGTAACLPACSDDVVPYGGPWRRTDPGAFTTVVETTAAWLAGNRSCDRQCTDWAGAVACCDDIYIPSFFFRCGPGVAWRQLRWRLGVRDPADCPDPSAGAACMPRVCGARGRGTPAERAPAAAPTPFLLRLGPRRGPAGMCTASRRTVPRATRLRCCPPPTTASPGTSSSRASSTRHAARPGLPCPALALGPGPGRSRFAPARRPWRSRHAQLASALPDKRQPSCCVPPAANGPQPLSL